MSTTKTEKIHLALAAILVDVQAIQKDRRNEQQGFKFRGIDDIYNALHGVFSAHGVVCVPLVSNLLPQPVFQNAKGNNVFRVFVEVGYRLVASDGSFVEGKTVGEGMDFADKATAKALSAAHKYFLIQTFLIPTADIAEQDIDTTIDPHEELKALEDQKRRENELARQEKALEEKRAALEKQAAAGGPAGAQQVPNQTTPPAAPAGPQEPEKPALAPETPAATEKSAGGRTTKAQRAAAAAERSSSPAPAPATQETAAPAEEQQGDQHPEWYGHVITAINAPKYKGRRVAELSLGELRVLKANWSDKPEFREGIAAEPAKVILREHLNAALIAREQEASAS